MSFLITLVVFSLILYGLAFGVPEGLTDRYERVRLYLKVKRQWKKSCKQMWADFDTIRREDKIP